MTVWYALGAFGIVCAIPAAAMAAAVAGALVCDLGRTLRGTQVAPPARPRARHLAALDDLGDDLTEVGEQWLAPVVPIRPLPEQLAAREVGR
jgi:hypothetical protein